MPKSEPKITMDCPCETDDGAEDMVGAVQPLLESNPHKTVTQIKLNICLIVMFSSDFYSSYLSLQYDNQATVPTKPQREVLKSKSGCFSRP